MPRIHLLVIAVLAGLSPIASAQRAEPAAKKLYCWDEGGRRMCGDALPPSAVDAPRVEINPRSGLPIARYGRALTPEERAAAEAVARSEQAVVDAAEAEKRRWMAMVDSFQSEAELRRAFDLRVQISQDAIKTARMGVDGLRQSLLGLLQRATQFELDRKPVPAKLAEDIREQHAERVKQQALLARLEEDAVGIRLQFDEAVSRYRELRGIGDAGDAPAGPAAPQPAG